VLASAHFLAGHSGRRRSALVLSRRRRSRLGDANIVDIEVLESAVARITKDTVGSMETASAGEGAAASASRGSHIVVALGAARVTADTVASAAVHSAHHLGTLTSRAAEIGLLTFAHQGVSQTGQGSAGADGRRSPLGRRRSCNHHVLVGLLLVVLLLLGRVLLVDNTNLLLEGLDGLAESQQGSMVTLTTSTSQSNALLLDAVTESLNLVGSGNGQLHLELATLLQLGNAAREILNAAEQEVDLDLRLTTETPLVEAILQTSNLGREAFDAIAGLHTHTSAPSSANVLLELAQVVNLLPVSIALGLVGTSVRNLAQLADETSNAAFETSQVVGNVVGNGVLGVALLLHFLVAAA